MDWMAKIEYFFYMLYQLIRLVAEFLILQGNEWQSTVLISWRHWVDLRSRMR